MSAIMVASAKGGVGKSTLCTGLGRILAEQGHKTLLIDMDIGVRSLDLLLNVAEKTVYNWGDVMVGNCEP
jgi:septum site-determining protein MinD